MRSAAVRTPVTLLTGFLGSGKTTLLNRLLADPAAGRTAVVMNEAGEVPLDHDLVLETTETLVLLRSGCVCCTVRGDLAFTLLDLDRRRAAGELGFERVVVETTGLADPAPILQTLSADGAIARRYALDGVVTTADALHGPATLDAQFEAVSQVAMADRIVVTKAECVDPAALFAFEARLAALNPGAPRLRAAFGRVPPGALFGLGRVDEADAAAARAWVDAPAFAAATAASTAALAADPAAQLVAATGLRRPAPAPSALSRASVAAPGSFRHDAEITSRGAVIDRPIAPDVFELWLMTMIRMMGPNILRMKAIVHVEGAPTPFAIHGVRDVVDPPVPLPRWPAEDRSSRIVVIGRNLPLALLEDSFAFLRLRP
ncbi:MAG: CobW family GTP-binding protein [Rubrimonas sp.]